MTLISSAVTLIIQEPFPFTVLENINVVYYNKANIFLTIISYYIRIIVKGSRKLGESLASNLNPDKPMIGFDLGGTKMLSLVLNNEYQILGRERKKTKDKDSGELNVNRIIGAIKFSLESSNSAKIPGGIGIGVPGTLDLKNGVVLEAPNLGWKNLPIRELLEKEFSCPVVISNDVDAGVYGEYCFGAGRNSQSVLGVFPGTGIGGGFVKNGDLFTSNHTSCMEIGHLPVVADGLECGCGRSGCLETVASRLAISAAASMAIYRGEAPNLRKISGTDISLIRSGALASAIAAGDKKIEQIVRHAAMHLGRVLGGIINLLAPQTVVLGGGLVEAMPELYLEEVSKHSRNHVMPSFENTYKIAVAELGDDATALGAAAWARKVIKT